MKHIETAVAKRLETSAQKPILYKVIKSIFQEKGKSIPRGAVVKVTHRGTKAGRISPIPDDYYSLSVQQPDGTFKHAFNLYDAFLVTLKGKFLKRISTP